MFNTDFLAGLLVLVLTVAGALALGSLTGVNSTMTLVTLAGAVWGLAWVWERRMRRAVDLPEEQPIHVDWEDRLTATDFGSDGELTTLDLATLDLTPETALGRTFVFATEEGDPPQDIWFEGRFVRDGDRIVIRAADPIEAQTISTSAIRNVRS